jgi:hypothetical protein
MDSSVLVRRATTLDELSKASEKFTSDEGWQVGLDFKPRPSDVIISPFAKSGTTWLQQIAHGLRTRGSMDFEEITVVTPWIEQAHDLGWDLEAEHAGNPRVFKSHLNWYTIPKGGRYIYSIRNPLKVAVSYYRFLEGWWFETGSISLEDFILERIIKNYETKGYWHHISSWWEQRENPDILFLCYENMIDDLVGTVKTVAQFMDITLDAELLDIVVRQSSKEFMLANSTHFDEHPMQEYCEKISVTPASPTATKVMPKSSNPERYILSSELIQEFDVIWDKMITQRFGFKDYSELQIAIGEQRSM